MRDALQNPNEPQRADESTIGRMRRKTSSSRAPWYRPQYILHLVEIAGELHIVSRGSRPSRHRRLPKGAKQPQQQAANALPQGLGCGASGANTSVVELEEEVRYAYAVNVTSIFRIWGLLTWMGQNSLRDRQVGGGAMRTVIYPGSFDPHQPPGCGGAGVKLFDRVIVAVAPTPTTADVYAVRTQTADHRGG